MSSVFNFGEEEATRDTVWPKILELLEDPGVSEVEANGPNLFFIKNRGKRIHLSEDFSYSNDEEYIKGIEEGLIPLVKHILPYKDNSYLFEGPLDYRTKNGERIRGRVHIVLPPSTERAQVTIAKKSTSLATLDSIANAGSMSAEMLEFIKTAISANLTITISGSTGAGKTTMLEACTKLWPNTIRIGVAEDAPELDLVQENVAYLHSVPWQPGLDPNSVATLTWVVQQFQRMRVDKLIIGETRGKEFAEFLVAANSGMEGSMTTIHANDPRSCLMKMADFALKGSERQPIRSINSSIANAIDIIIQLTILPDGRHKVLAIEEITKTISNSEDASITTSPLFQYDPTTDSFIKKAMISDHLRKVFSGKGVEFDHLLRTPINSISKPITSGGPALQDLPEVTPRTGGLPVPSQRRTI